jgi:hypothetical protein
MKNFFIYLLLLYPSFTFAQLGFKAGLNFANVTNAGDINNSSSTGYHVGLFFSGSSKNILSSHTELQFSRQGYKYSINENTGVVNLSYLMLPQFMAINITKYVQLQLGAQVAYLLNAEVDTTASTGNAQVDNAIKLYNRFDYGFGGGVQVHPVKMLVVGARMNVFLGNLYKEPEPGEDFSFIPEVNIRNNVVQLYAGVRFGGD